MKVSELTGTPLDYWVAKAEGKDNPSIEGVQCFIDYRYPRYPKDPAVRVAYMPSTAWAQGGPIIESEKIMLLCYGEKGAQCQSWEAQIGGDSHYIDQYPGDAVGGPAPLIAAMRAFVASKYGEEVPD